MALVTVTYNAWDHSRQVIPASLHPEVWFRPLRTSLANGMMTNREVKGSLSVSSGAGSVQLESAPGLLYVPFMRWLADPSQADETVQNRAFEYAEWQPILPGNGGDISDLADLRSFGPIIAALGAPPDRATGVVWIDLTDVSPAGALVYAPEEAF